MSWKFVSFDYYSKLYSLKFFLVSRVVAIKLLEDYLHKLLGRKLVIKWWGSYS